MTMLVRALSTGRFALDGGAMFGNVPYTLWSRFHTPDDRFRIPLELRVLYAEGDGRRILVDTGTGHLWNSKEVSIYQVSADNEPPVVKALRDIGVDPETITDVILTHLHFDHAGGVTRRGDSEAPVLTFPNAVHHVQGRNLEAAMHPNPRERASYLEHHWRPLLGARLRLLSGEGEILPDVWVTVSDGHTRGLQVVRFGQGEGAVIFPADMIPTAQHVAVPWTMGYDLWVERLMEEKSELLEQAYEHGHHLVFEHDPHCSRARVDREKERFVAVPIET
jgi:glyoxylase-like metal-dependent hydrolase (beta-lactamase superfamily II)